MVQRERTHPSRKLSLFPLAQDLFMTTGTAGQEGLSETAKDERRVADRDLSGLRIERPVGRPRPRRVKRYGVALFILLLFGGIGYLYRLGLLTPAIEVRVATVQELYPSQTLTLLNASGYVVAQRKASVASKITGRLVFLGVEEGSRVRTGQLIARLENDDVLAAIERTKAHVEASRHNLAEARAQLKDATLSYERIKRLVEAKIVSQSDYDASEARFSIAKAALGAREAALQASLAAVKEAEIQLEYTNIRAPFDAVVLTKNADIGDIVTPIGAAANAKAAVVNIADMGSLQAEVDVSESNIDQVRVGQPCEIRLDALPDTRFRGKVHMIVPTADRSKASVMVKVAFLDHDPRILPEMSAKVAFLSREVLLEEQKPVTAIPSSALIKADGKLSVFVLQADRARRGSVETGRVLGDMTEVMQGLRLGERVIVDPLDRILEGSRVSVPEN
jgi:RND family efflux transporter MFP subunit